MTMTAAFAWLLLLALPSHQQQPATIQGSIRNLQGHPISGATVYAYDSAHLTGRFVRLTTLSESDGSFVIHNVPPGNYAVHAFKESDGYADTFWWFFRTNNTNAWKTVQVSAGRTSFVALALGPKYARLNVSIRNERGQPVGGGLSFRRVDDRDPTYRVGVNADSERLVPPVSFSFDVQAPGYQTWHSPILSPKPEESLTIVVRLTRSH
jgi:hypothetical protein